jgi:hypothetical protein
MMKPPPVPRKAKLHSPVKAKRSTPAKTPLRILTPVKAEEVTVCIPALRRVTTIFGSRLVLTVPCGILQHDHHTRKTPIPIAKP